MKELQDSWAVGSPPEMALYSKGSRYFSEGEEPALEPRGRLRKLASLRYLKRKVRGWLRPEHRDTIVCEEDEEAVLGRRNIYDIIVSRDAARSGFDLGKFGSLGTASSSSGYDLGDDIPSVACAAKPTATAAVMTTTDRASEPSRETRWCLNCSKCFQRRLSRFENFCGLDCKTAHRFRQSMCSQAPHHLCYYPSQQSPSRVRDD